jgi:hypothetical protein
MGRLWQSWRRIRLDRWITIRLARSASLSIGIPGCRLTVSRRRLSLRLGIPLHGPREKE